MKKSLILIACSLAIVFTSCSSDATDSATSTATSTAAAAAEKMKNSEIAKDMTDAMNKGGEAVTDAADKIMPDGKMDETVDKMADKMKGAMQKGKEKMADGMAKTKDKMNEKVDQMADKADMAAEKVGNKAKEMGDKMKEKVGNTATKMEDKMDKAVGSVSTAAPAVNPTPKTVSTPAPKEMNKPKVNKKAPADVVKKEDWKNGKPDHNAFNKLLSKHVSSSGKVNYKGFKADNHMLEDYLSQLQDNPIKSGWSKKEKLAYWINAYNAYTIKLIVDNYPVSSITDLHGGKPWDAKWIKLDGKTLSLNNIENDIIRPTFKEPRIHFAVNCAAKSCPPLSNSVWTAANLESKFETATKKFVNDSKYNSVSSSGANVSKIFEWYKEDFGDLTAFLNKYANSPLGSGGKISFMEYDWKLNE